MNDFAPEKPPVYTTSAEMTAARELGSISGLREQIKANAALLFPHGAAGMADLAYDVIIMTYTADTNQSSTPKYQAVLTYIGGLGQVMRKNTIAAKGPPSDGVVASLENLLLVTAVALEKYQGNVVAKDLVAPEEVAGGVIDQGLVLGKSRKSWLGKERS